MSNYHQCRRHLDQLLRALRQDALPMTLCEFDGFATGLLACPIDIPFSEWLPQVWGRRGLGQFPDRRAAVTTIDAVLAYHDALALALSQTGRVRPSYQGSGQPSQEMWKPWIDGYLRAALLRPDVWQDVYERAGEDVQTLMSFVQSLHDIYTGRSSLSALQATEMDRVALETIPHCVTQIIKHTRPDRLLPNAANRSEAPKARRGKNIPPDRSGHPV